MEIDERTVVDVRGLTNEQLLELGMKLQNPTVLVVELLLRLECYVELYGDYLSETN